MARNRTTYQNVIFFRKYLYYFQSFHLYPVTAHTACHAHAFEYTGRIRRTTNGTGRSLAIVLTVTIIIVNFLTDIAV